MYLGDHFLFLLSFTQSDKWFDIRIFELHWLSDPVLSWLSHNSVNVYCYLIYFI